VYANYVHINCFLRRKTGKRREENELEGERKRVWDRMKRKEAGSGGRRKAVC